MKCKKTSYIFSIQVKSNKFFIRLVLSQVKYMFRSKKKKIQIVISRNKRKPKLSNWARHFRDRYRPINLLNKSGLIFLELWKLNFYQNIR